jgi:methylmalonyl-CoA mutase
VSHRSNAWKNLGAERNNDEVQAALDAITRACKPGKGNLLELPSMLPAKGPHWEKYPWPAKKFWPLPGRYPFYIRSIFYGN